MKNPHAKTYTVTISGREREDGEKPFTWVVDAGSEFLAGCKALGFHSDAMDEDFEDLKIEEIFEGLPAENCGYYWNDMRAPANVDQLLSGTR